MRFHTKYRYLHIKVLFIFEHMLAVFIIYDPHYANRYHQWFTSINMCMPHAHVFILQRVGQTPCSFGALFNAGVKSAGLGKRASICCISPMMTLAPPIIDIRTFLHCNGFDNGTGDIVECTNNGYRENNYRHIATNMIEHKCIHFQIEMCASQSNVTDDDPYLIPPVRC